MAPAELIAKLFLDLANGHVQLIVLLPVDSEGMGKNLNVNDLVKVQLLRCALNRTEDGIPGLLQPCNRPIQHF